MSGSTFYHAPIVAEQGAKAALFYDDDVFPTIELAVLQTPDFWTMLSNTDLRWSEGQPIYFEEEENSCIFKINPTALEFVLGCSPYDESERDDLRRLKEFVAQHGVRSIYQSATL